MTLEANPEDVTAERAAAWAAAGVNRVSVGVQSFSDRELAAVGRQARRRARAAALETLSGAGFSVSGDLILGLPEQTAETFRRSAAGLAAAGIEHVSVYLLETEKSKLDRRGPAGSARSGTSPTTRRPTSGSSWTGRLQAAVSATTRSPTGRASVGKRATTSSTGRAPRRSASASRRTSSGPGAGARTSRRSPVTSKRWRPDASPRRPRPARGRAGSRPGAHRPRPSPCRGRRGRRDRGLDRRIRRPRPASKTTARGARRACSHDALRPGRLHGARVPAFERDPLPIRLTPSAKSRSAERRPGMKRRRIAARAATSAPMASAWPGPSSRSCREIPRTGSRRSKSRAETSRGSGRCSPRCG